MRKKMRNLIDRLNTSMMYFTENPINIDDYWGYRYFLVWQNTHNIYIAFKTQNECIEFLQEIITNSDGIIQIGGTELKIIK